MLDISTDSEQAVRDRFVFSIHNKFLLSTITCKNRENLGKLRKSYHHRRNINNCCLKSENLRKLGNSGERK